MKLRSVGSTGSIRLFREISSCSLAGVFLILLPLSLETADAAQNFSDVHLAWEANPDSQDVSGYKVHWGVTSRTYTQTLDAGNSTAFVLQGMEVGVTYYISLTAYNEEGLESEYSTELPVTLSATSGPPSLSVRGISRSQGGTLSFEIRGGSGSPIEVQVSDDLAEWELLGTVSDPGTTLEIDDPLSTSQTRRFYRLESTETGAGEP